MKDIITIKSAWQVVKEAILDGENTAPRVGQAGVDLAEFLEGEVFFTNSTPVPVAIGGIPAGTTFDNKSVNEMLTSLLYPTLNPVLVAPSVSMTSSSSGLMKIGSSVIMVLSIAFNRGSITPQYSAVSPYRAGLASGYSFTGPGTGFPTTNTIGSFTAPAYTILIGVQTWGGSVSFYQGAQPKDNKGNNYSTPLSAGTLVATSKTITGVYPCYATVSSITVVSELPLQLHGSDLIVSVPAESGAERQTVKIPEIWGVIGTIQQLNTLSGLWDTISLASFVETTETINGVNYNVFTHTGSSIGARQLKFKI